MPSTLDLNRFRTLEENMSTGSVALSTVTAETLVLLLANIPEYADEAAAETASLPADSIFRITGTGALNIKLANA